MLKLGEKSKKKSTFPWLILLLYHTLLKHRGQQIYLTISKKFYEVQIF